MSIQLVGLIIGLGIFAGYLGLAYHFSKPGSYEKAGDFKQMGIGRGSYRGNNPLQTPLKSPMSTEKPLPLSPEGEDNVEEPRNFL